MSANDRAGELVIYQPAKTAMQSGRARTRGWLAEFAPSDAKRRDPLMGWSGSGDTRRQCRMKFETKDAAIAYAERNGFAYRVMEPRTRRTRPKSYADNFRHDRQSNWSH